MKKFYSVSIHGEFANVLCIEKKRAFYNITSEEVVDLVALPAYLKNKRSFYVVIAIDELIDEVVTVPSVIKNKQVLQSYILKRFKDSLPTKNILLNFHKIAEDKEESTISYKVDAVAEKEYIKNLELIPDWKEIRSATIDKFALLNLTRKCYTPLKGYGYFSVYTHGNMVTVLAIDERDDLLFERTSTSVSGVDNSQYLNIVEEVNQTIAYVKQQFRSVDFSTLVVSGSLALDDQAAEHLLFSTNLGVAVMYPNTFIKGLVDEEPQQYIITLGSFLVNKADMFLPDKVYSLREYEIVTISLMFISTLAFVVSTYLAYEQYSYYSDALDRYDNIKSKLLHMIRTTDTYSLQELEKSYKHLQIAEKYLRYHPADILLKLKPLIELLPPSHYLFDDKNSKEPTFSFRFTKKFTNLSDLYSFQQNFLGEFSSLNGNNTMKYSESTDYSNMKFIVDIMSNAKKKAPIVHRRRRRR